MSVYSKNIFNSDKNVIEYVKLTLKTKKKTKLSFIIGNIITRKVKELFLYLRDNYTEKNTN